MGVLKWAISHDLPHLGKLLIVLKVSDGRVIHKGRHNRHHLKALRRLGLVGYDKVARVYFQRTWEEIEAILGIETMGHVTITAKTLFKYDFRDVAYSAGLQYLFRIQDDGGKPNGKPSKKGAHMQPSDHIGGISHSLVAEFFGATIHWSFLRRVSCNESGLVRFDIRKKKLKELISPPDMDTPYRSVFITSKLNFRVRFSFGVPCRLRGKLERRVFNAKQGCYEFVIFS